MQAERASQAASAVTTGAAETDDNPSYGVILRQRALWGGMLGTFCSNYAFYFVFSWLPLYLVKERGLTLEMMTYATTAFFIADGASILLVGYMLDRWVKRGAASQPSCESL